MLTTALCPLLGIEHPILSAGIGAAAGAELVAAVSNAGAGGVLGTAALPAKFVRQQIHRVRELTDKPFGVNLVLSLLRRGQFEACLDERVPFVVLFWGDPAAYVGPAHAQGIKVLMQVGSVDEARAAAAAGVDAVIAQGHEAGGHVKGTTALSVLLPAVVDAVGPLPVLASGGVADGRGLLSVLSLGGQGVSLGTRFLASHEASTAPAYKDRVLRAGAEDTVHTTLFDGGWAGAPQRVLRNAAYLRWQAAGCSPSGQRPGEGLPIGTMTSGGSPVEVPAYSAHVPGIDAGPMLDEMALYAGESCALIDDIVPAGDIVRQIMQQAEQALDHLNGLRRDR